MDQLRSVAERCLTLKRLSTLQIGNDWLGDREGGLNRFYAELLRHLPDAGVDVHGLVAGSARVAQQSAGTVEAIASSEASLFYRLYRARQSALRSLNQNKVDLIATHFALYALPLLDQLDALPAVVHFHGPWAGEGGAEGGSTLFSKVQALIERTVYRRGLRLIVLSRAFAQELASRYGAPEESIRVIPGGIDLDRFSDQLSRMEARERLNWPRDRPIVIAVRRQVRRMGLENLVDSICHVRQAVPEILVLLAGAGPLANALQTRIADQQLQQNVRLLGRVSEADLPLVYRAADLSIVPSQSLEGFGMITLESLASGTPVLVTKIGGLPEVIGPFAPQCVLEGTTTEILSVALVDFLRGARSLPSSEACRSYAALHYSWPAIAERTRQVYEEALR